jgi:oxygen-dependent protoporphyrinogen oxidase
MARVVVVGAGISGLALAFRLEQLSPQTEIIVLEQAQRPGGKIWTERLNGFQIETGPNGYLDTKLTTEALCRDLGLEHTLIQASEVAAKHRYLFLNGRLRLLPASFPAFLTSDLLTWRGKLDFLLERFRRRHVNDPDESIAAFARRRAGRAAAEVFADALVTGIYAGDPALLSVRACFPRLVAFEEQHGSVLKGLAHAARERRAEAAARGQAPRRQGRMWSLRPGLRLLVETLGDRLQHPPHVGVSVRTVQPLPGPRASWLVKADGADAWTADAVVLACPAYQQAVILADLDTDLAELVGGIAYNRLVVVALGFRRADVPARLDGFGYIAPQRLGRDVLGVQWCSSIYPDRAPEGAVLLRAMCGGWHRADVAGWDDARLLHAVRDDLRQTLGIAAAPALHHLIRWDRAIPQYHVGHLERLARIETFAARHPGLFLAGNAYYGVALNDCTEQAERLAAQVHRYLGQATDP